MLRAQLMVRTEHRPLEEGPSGISPIPAARLGGEENHLTPSSQGQYDMNENGPAAGITRRTGPNPKRVGSTSWAF